MKDDNTAEDTNTNGNSKADPLKLLLIGDSTVGKTCFYLRYTTGLFNSDHVTTIGVDYFPTSVILPDKKEVNIRLWDTAGQDRFRAITKNYIRGAHGILLLYDITCMKTFENVGKWISQVRDMSIAAKIQIIVIGNKCDMEKTREVPIESGRELAESQGCLFIEASAKSNTNITEAIVMLTEKAYSDYLINNIKNGGDSKGKPLEVKGKKKRITCCP